MAGVFGAHVLQVLRLLTPSEITRLKDSLADGENVKAVASIEGNSAESVLKKRSETGEEIPDHPEGEKELSAENNLEDNVISFKKKEQENLERAGVYSAQKIDNEKNKKIEAENNCKETPTVFILSEKEKFKGVKTKLSKKDAIKSYKKNISVEKGDGEEDLAKSTTTGVLVDRIK